MNVAFRDVNPEVFRMFKAESARLGIKMGNAVSEAFKYWLEYKTKKQKKRSFLDLKPRSFGVGETDSATEIDKFAYGGKE
ncbi:MAG: hypothetical protein J4415_01020 [Candidatus Diapherotrites archaeon]|uniref:Uncharacterized protein n=1 Tax=Candidatus Iainarchaeum sp. TaxID=3101447 RepID=A0A8T4KWC3_9ARCH|nr:hypothetical protein [Candidatus Diapherotrites archaeon]